MMRKLLITGGSGFIGSALIRYIINHTHDSVINVDKLTYAANQSALEEVENNPRYVFEKIDICDLKALERIFNKYQPDSVMHLAAESHVDRSIDGPAAFIQTNVIGTFILLEASRQYYASLDDDRKKVYRFHHISTDEVFGDLHDADGLFTEETPYAPSSPYSASKAGSDHLVRAWNRTYGLPTVITNCSNNYGPYHFPEKLIPLIILNALSGKPLPVYGNGEQIRDWLYVDDHARALYKVATEGKIGDTYCIGGHNERKNIDVVKTICAILDKIIDKKPNGIVNFAELITFVADRPGHDLRYAIDATKMKNDLGWEPLETFESGIEKTIQWYLNNEGWWQRVLDGSYAGERLGLNK